MSSRIVSGEFRSSSLSEGRCFLYVLPCPDEEILKLGFSRDPLRRLQALHPRYYEFFDLDRAFLVETETVREARRFELALRRALTLHNAPVPLVIRPQAGGETEWYRGAYASLVGTAEDMAATGFQVHKPLRPWLKWNLLAKSDTLFSWAAELLDVIELESPAGPLLPELRQALMNTLDAYVALGVELEPLISAAVFRAHRELRHEDN